MHHRRISYLSETELISSTKEDNNKEVNDYTPIIDFATHNTIMQNATFDCLINVASHAVFEHESILFLYLCNIVFKVSSLQNPLDKDTINCQPVWCTDFVDLHHRILFELIDAWVFLKIDPLIDNVSLQLSIVFNVSLTSFHNDL